MKPFSQRTTPWNAEWSEEEIIHRFQTGIFLSQPMDTSFFDSTLEDCFGIIYLPELTSQPFRIISYSRQREVILDTLGDGKDLTSTCLSMQNIHDDYIDRHKLDEGWHWLPYNAETIRKLYRASIQGSSTRDHEGILVLNDELQREMPPGSWTEMYEVLRLFRKVDETEKTLLAC